MPSTKPKRSIRRPKVPTPKPKTRAPDLTSVKFAASEVQLAETKGSRGKGGDRGGHAWIILVGGKRAGTIFINFIDEPPIGPHASIQIYLNQKSQGRGIGRAAYRKAAEASQYDVIYAHMRKSNTASRRAAEEAGFVDASPQGFTQLLMRWQREG